MSAAKKEAAWGLIRTSTLRGAALTHLLLRLLLQLVDVRLLLGELAPQVGGFAALLVQLELQLAVGLPLDAELVGQLLDLLGVTPFHGVSLFQDLAVLGGGRKKWRVFLGLVLTFQLEFPFVFRQLEKSRNQTNVCKIV